MRVILYFKSGHRYVGDTKAMIFNEHPSHIIKRIELHHATDEEFDSLRHNPHQDSLLAEIANRRVR